MTAATPALSVLVPTVDPERPLARCLRSIAAQPLLPGDEVLVIGDAADGPLPWVESLIGVFGPPFKYVAVDAGHHCYGHCPLNRGLELARGDLVLVQDDDDVYVPGAFDVVRRAASRFTEPRPLMFCFVPWFRQRVWSEQKIVENGVGGHCLVAPNIPERLGRFTCRYEGDFDYVRSTIDLWPNKDDDVVWCADVLTVARPEQ